MDSHTKTKLALIMLPSQLRRTILLVLMIAALTIVAINDIKNSKKNLEKMKRTKCLTSYVIKNVKKEYKENDIKNDIKNSKKNLEKIKRTKCLTSYVIKNVKKYCKKDA